MYVKASQRRIIAILIHYNVQAAFKARRHRINRVQKSSLHPQHTESERTP